VKEDPMGIRPAPGRPTRRLRSHPRFALAKGAALATAWLSLGGAAQASTLIDFESLASGTDAAAASLPGVAISGALVLDEASVELLLGVPAIGTWNTTPGGSHGALDSLAPEIGLAFASPATSVSVNVLALPDGQGDAGVVRLQAFDGNALVASDVSDPGAIGDSGFPEASLSVSAAHITRAVLCSDDAGSCLDPGVPSRFWIDDLSFEAVPEPESLALLSLGLALLATATGQAPRGRADSPAPVASREA
jgi:hypothetical protein